MNTFIAFGTSFLNIEIKNITFLTNVLYYITLFIDEQSKRKEQRNEPGESDTQREKRYSRMSPVKYKTMGMSGTDSYDIMRKCYMLSAYFGN